MMYKTTKYLQVISRDDGYAVYNSLASNSLLLIEKQAYDLLMKFHNGASKKEILKFYNSREAEDVVELLIESKILIKFCEDERDFVISSLKSHKQYLEKGPLEGLVLEVTKLCNMRCIYCFAFLLSETEGRQSNGTMSFEVAKKSVDLLFESAKKNNKNFVEISFMGGEPLLNFPLIEKVILYCKGLQEESGIKIVYSMTTNGTLITDKIALFIKENQIRICVSLDGSKSIHDKTRVYANGEGSFDHVFRGINILKSHNIQTTVLTTITNNNFQYIDFNYIDLLKELKVKNWGINVEDMRMLLETDIEILSRRILDLCRYSLELGIDAAGMWFKPVFTLTQERYSYCKAAAGSFISVEPNGQVYACSRSKTPIGNISSGKNIFRSPEYLRFGAQILGYKKECVGCEIEGQCLGGCPAVNDAKRNDSCGLTGCGTISCDFTRKITRSAIEDTSNILLG